MHSSAAHSPLTIRTMSRSEIDLAVDWAAAEGWNPGLTDAEAFYAADPEGFFLARLADQPVGCVSAVAYGSTFGFLGFYIVRPEFRGRGYGLKLWHAALDRLAGRTIGLDGVIAQLENYQKSGFRIAYRNIRFEGKAASTPAVHADIVPVSKIDFNTLLAYDAPFFPAPRPDFLRAWIAQPGAAALAILRRDTLAGYGMIRPCRSGYKIGPLFAGDAALAESLLAALTAEIPAHSTFYLDIPEPNSAALALVGRHRMTKVFETARMYNAPAPTLPLARLFGVTTFELG